MTDQLNHTRPPMRTSSMREANSALVVDEIHRRGVATRSDLAEATSLTPQALGPILADLVSQSLVLEEMSVRSGPGRPPLSYRINPVGALTVVVAYRYADAFVIINDALDNVVATARFRHEPNSSTEAVLGATREAIEAKLGSRNMELSTIKSLVLAIEGRVDDGHNVVHETPSWADRSVELAPLIADLFGAHVELHTTSAERALTIFALRAIEPDPSEFVLVVQIGHETSMQLAVGEQLITSRRGRSGRILHTKVVDNDRLCDCGKIGCFATVTGGPFIVDVYEELTGQRLPAAVDVVDRISEGDLMAAKAAQAPIYWLAKGIAPIIHALDPDRLVFTGAVGGPESHGAKKLVEVIRGELDDVYDDLTIDTIQPYRASVNMARLLIQ